MEMKIDDIVIGKTYQGTTRETQLVKNRGGYYTGYTRKETGRVCKIEFRVDKVQNESLWGSWIETCGNRRSVGNYFSIKMLDEVETKNS